MTRQSQNAVHYSKKTNLPSGGVSSFWSPGSVVLALWRFLGLERFLASYPECCEGITSQKTGSFLDRSVLLATTKQRQNMLISSRHTQPQQAFYPTGIYRHKRLYIHNWLYILACRNFTGQPGVKLHSLNII